MMFMMHASFMLGLIAFLGGLGFLIWGLRSDGPGKELAKFFGIIVLLFVVIDFNCVGYYALNYWREGYFATPTGVMQSKP